MMSSETRYSIRREDVAMERTLADVRIILWLATAVVSIKQLSETEAEATWHLGMSLGVFLIYSFGMWFIARYRQQFLRLAVPVSSLCEVVLITIVIWFTYGYTGSPFYLWYVFYVVSISLRYGLQMSILGLAASIVLYEAVAFSPANRLVYASGFLGYTGFLFVLALLFGHMSERQKSYQTRLAAVNELGVALASLSASRDIIRLLVTQTAGLLHADRCWFSPCRDDGNAESLPVALGIENDRLAALVDSLGDWSPARVIEERQARLTNRPRRDARLPSEAVKGFGIKSIAAVPLYVREVPVGVLYAADKQPRGFSGYDMELLELIGAQAAPIIENIQLWERLKDAAAAEERLRIARDLHDNFLQTLSAIKLYLERCRLLIDKDAEKAKAAVDRMHQISTEGLADVRSYLSQLRLMGPEPSLFGQAVERCAMECAARGGFAAHVEIDMPEEALTPQISLAAFQILRELLNNVVKHAEANNVWITARHVGGPLELNVRDDGTGFDLEVGRRASAKGHLGIVGIEERVAELSGEFEIKSRPGAGTAASISLPIPETPEG